MCILAPLSVRLLNVYAESLKKAQKRRQGPQWALPSTPGRIKLIFVERVHALLIDAWWRFLPKLRPRRAAGAVFFFLRASIGAAFAPVIHFLLIFKAS